MKAIYSNNTAAKSPNKSPKLATLTALAAACTMMLSAPVHAAEADATATSVPSAVDSSKRVIRLARPGATASTAQGTTEATPSNGTQSVGTQPMMPSTNAQPNRIPLSTAQAAQMMQSSNTQPNRVPVSAAQPPASQMMSPANAPVISGTTRVYEPGPMSAAGIDLRSGQLPNIPTPRVQLSDMSFVKTVLIPQQTGLGTDKLDVSLLDDFIADVSPNARHYPPNFPNRTQRHYTREKIKVLTDWIEPYAKSPNASYDVLLRAAKLNGMGRNLDLGSDYTVRGGQYVDRAIKIQPNSGEANFLYGMMLSEGGGFKEGQKYLEKAVSVGYTEAEQSLAQSDLLSDRRANALERLRRLEGQYPNNRVIPQQIKLVEEGKFYIWDIPAPDINVKPGA